MGSDNAWNERNSSSARAPRWLLVGLGVLLVLVGGVIGGLIAAATQSSDSNSCSATSVADKTLPSVVTIIGPEGDFGWYRIG